MAEVERNHPQLAPPLNQSDAIASLLSLSFAAGGLAPVNPTDTTSDSTSALVVDANEPAGAAPIGSAQPTPSSVPATSALSNGAKHHRRLSSTGKTRRRMSDAREAANRPSPSLLQSTSAALSLASLSLSSSPPSGYPGHISTSFTGASRTLAPAPPKGTNITAASALPLNDGSKMPQAIPITNNNSNGDEFDSATPIPISSSNGRSGKKRGMDHKCESCSKIYRHPSCLIKHRWEHTPHWREASKFVLSKHQQVQLLEAAAILSHMSPAVSGGKSLPDDRSLWPSFLSGGSLPPPEAPIPTNRNGGSSTSSSIPNSFSTATNTNGNGNGGMSGVHTVTSPSPSYLPHPVSSSVPASTAFTRATSTGPRLHDYSIPSNPGGVGVTQLRPGLMGVHTGGSDSGATGTTGTGTPTGTGTASIPVPVPNGSNANDSVLVGYRSVGGDSWASHSSYGGGHGPSSYQSQSHSHFQSVGGAGSFGHYPSHLHSSYGSHRHMHRSSDERHSSAHGAAAGVNGNGHGAGSIGTGGWSLPRSSLRSVSLSSKSRSRSGSASENSNSNSNSNNSRSEDDESESVGVDVDVDEVNVDVDVEEAVDHDDDMVGSVSRGRYGYTGLGGYAHPHHGGGVGGGGVLGYGRRVWKREDEDEMSVGFSVREEDEDDLTMGSIKGRERGGLVAARKREEPEWDGMEMDMEMD